MENGSEPIVIGCGAALVTVAIIALIDLARWWRSHRRDR
jgi:hypothetical protein